MWPREPTPGLQSTLRLEVTGQDLLPRVKNPGGKNHGNGLRTCVLSGASTLKSFSWTNPDAPPMATWRQRTYIHTMPANIPWRTHTLVWIECILARAVGRTRIWRAVGWHLAFTARSYIVALALVDVDLGRRYRNPWGHKNNSSQNPLKAWDHS